MLTFLIVAAMMLVVLMLDYRPLIKGGNTKLIIVYGVLAAVSLAILALISFGVNLPSIYGY